MAWVTWSAADQRVARMMLSSRHDQMGPSLVRRQAARRFQRVASTRSACGSRRLPGRVPLPLLGPQCCACARVITPGPSMRYTPIVEDSKWHAVLSVARIARLAAICVGCRQVRRGHIARNAPLLARVGHAVGNLVASRERVFRICLSGPQRGALVAASLPRALPLDAVRHCPKIDRKFTS